MPAPDNLPAFCRPDHIEIGRIILGNQAADLDSMASSLAYEKLCSLLTPAEAVMAVMPIPRSDFHLRREAVYVFRQAEINLDDLIFRDDIDLDSLPEQTRLVLIDHNILAPGLEKFSSRVTGILDHHQDNGLYPDADPRIIRPAGSTASLVTLEFQKNNIAITPNMAALLAGTILLDTVNLAERAGRVTEVDREAAAYLLPRCPLPQDKYFRAVQKAKFNLQGLSTNDLLRRDYKEWRFERVRCGIASVPLSVQDWLAHDADLASGVIAFAEQRELDLLLSMHAYNKPDFHRELVIFCRTKTAHDNLVCLLQDNGLELMPLNVTLTSPLSANGYIGLYSQGNIDMSRKRVQPLFSLHLLSSD